MSDDKALHELVARDPEQAWPLFLEYARQHPGSALALDLLEDFVYEHDDLFVARIEATALADPAFRELVDLAYVGGFATLGAEHFWEVQQRLRGPGS